MHGSFFTVLFSKADVNQFIQNGYVRLPQLLTADAYQVLVDAIEEQIYPTESILRRVGLISLAIQAYQQKYPTAEAYAWKHPEKDFFSQNITPDRVHNATLRLKSANYCLFET